MASTTRIDEPRIAHGAKAITRALRERVPQRQGHAALLLGDAPRMLLDFTLDQIVVPEGVPAASLAQDLSDRFESLSLHGLSERRYLELAGLLPRQPLRPLLWQWGQRPAHWQALDARLRRGARVRLLRWPDFRVLGHQHDSFRLCSLLLKRASSVEECATLLEVPEEAVRGVVRPAYLCGYAALEDPAPLPAPLRTGTGSATLLARMWRSVRQRGGG